MAETTATAGAEWKAHWPLVLSSMLAVTWVAAPTTSISLFLEPLHQEFGWSYSQITSGLFLYSVISVFLVPFFGALVDRFGTRTIALPGLLLNGLAYAAFSLATPSIALWLGGWVLYTLTQLMIGTYVWSGATSAAFSRSRGLAIGVVMGGIAVGQLVAPLAARWLIVHYDWRTAFAVLGLGWTGLAFVVGLLFFHDPRAKAKADALSAASQEPQKPAEGGLTLGEALRTPRFLRIALAILLQSMMISGISVHIIGLLAKGGISTAEAAAMAGLIGVATLLGQVFTGWLADRVSQAILPAICFLLPIVAYLLVLEGKGSDLMQWSGIMLAGYAGGAAINITTYLTSRYVGLAHFGKIYGVISSCMQVGAGCGPLLASTFVDKTHSYDYFLMLGIGFACVAGLSVIGLGAYPVFKPAGEAAKPA